MHGNDRALFNARGECYGAKKVSPPQKKSFFHVSEGVDNFFKQIKKSFVALLQVSRGVDIFFKLIPPPIFRFS